MSLRLSDFDFDLPERLIARYPARPRDSARLLLVRAAGLEDRLVSELPTVLRPGDLMVFNETKVIPAQLQGRRLRPGAGEAAVEITLHKRAGEDRWHAFAKPGRRLAPGDRVRFGKDFTAEVLAKAPDGDLLLRFDRAGPELMTALGRHGTMPLPPYIRKLRPVEATDAEDYQTVYAGPEGAVAAPTAGLHFTPALLERLAARGIERAALTLHVGAGTFLPVKAERIEEHRMHAEYGEIPPPVAEAVTRARAEGRRVVAVGTTSLRLLESAADEAGRLRPFAGETDIFITPGYRFRAVDLLMTNFHLPRSTLFMLVAAFAGLARMKQAYAHAIAREYRFFSYGDATLLERAA
ncbi:MAG TPA: tRNA preQ1(34) S-adenosylmethionine ribosyltransferase-isomerase QueA [Dongiaceae bacterium]|nr:tRNA preQ1(34) S-adenosylmethionine ribosyltransferase-isomerase QueA [Dongiaceae bacterium]